LEIDGRIVHENYSSFLTPDKEEKNKFGRAPINFHSDQNQWLSGEGPFLTTDRMRKNARPALPNSSIGDPIVQNFERTPDLRLEHPEMTWRGYLAYQAVFDDRRGNECHPEMMSGYVRKEELVDEKGIEPSASALRTRRSPS
jgi:hypothetical protein